MGVRLNLNPDVEARLIAEARSQGLPLERLAEQLLKDALSASPLSQGAMTVNEFRRILADIASGSEHLPDLPTESFSRETFYEDPLSGGHSVPRR